MPIGLPHNYENPNKGYTILLGVGCEIILPLEIQIPSLHIALIIEMIDEKKHQLRLQKLKALDDKRLQAQQQIELYQAQIFRAFNKKVREQIFKKRHLVLAVRRPMVMAYRRKKNFNSNGKDYL